MAGVNYVGTFQVLHSFVSCLCLVRFLRTQLFLARGGEALSARCCCFQRRFIASNTYAVCFVLCGVS